MTTCSSRRFLLAVVLLLAVASVTLLIAVTQFDPKKNPHAHFREPGSCLKCHVSVGGKPDPDRFIPESVDFCVGCHTESELGRSHPIRVRPRDKYWKMKVPKDFCLDDDGRMMCLTCHSGHGPFLSPVQAYARQKPENPGAAPGTSRYYRTLFVRRSDPARGYVVLCNGCHNL